MRIMDWYIVRKFLSTFFFIVLGLILIAIVIDVAEKIDSFIEHKPPVGLLIKVYYLNFALFFANLLSPLCVFLTVIFFTSRMTQNSEIVALLGGGVNFYRILAPFLVVSILLAFSSFYLNAYIVPIANQERVEFEYTYLRKNMRGHRQNIYRKIATNPEKKSESYVSFYSFSRFYLEGYVISLEEFVDGDLYKRLDCQKVHYDDSLKIWKMLNCEQRTFDGMEESLVKFANVDTTFLLSPDDIYVKDLKAESIPFDKLDAAIELERERGTELVKEFTLEKYERHAYPFSAIILTVLGFSLSTRKRRGGTPLQLIFGLLISFVYVFLVLAGQAFVGDEFPSWFAVWYPNIAFGLLAIIALWWAPK